MGIPDPAIKRIFKPLRKEMRVNVPRLTRYSEDWYALLTSMGLCARAQMNRFYSLENVTTFYNAVTGFDLSEEDLRISAERSWNLLKLLNAKEGFSRKDDKFPKEWFNSLNYGNNELQLQDFFGTTIITPTIANQFLDDYYDERGWNIENGIPSQKKLKELGLDIYL
jgi:aldehyde:ferredoxin oxidoreductase